MTNFRLLAFLVLLALGCASCSRQARVDRVLDRADASFAAGDFDKARVEYQIVERERPGDVHVLNRLADTWLQQGVPFRAAQYVLELLKVNPEDHAARARLAEIYLAVGDPASAYREAQTAATGTASALLTLARAAGTPEQVAEARRRLAEGELSPAARALAEASLRATEGQTDGARETLVRAAEQGAATVEGNITLAAMESVRGDAAAAAARLDEAVRVGGPRSAAPIAKSAFLASRGDLAGARKELEATLGAAADYIPAIIALARLDLREDRPTDAAARLKTVFSRDGANIEARLLEADLFMMQGQGGEAVAATRRLADTFPRLPIAKLYLARALVLNANPSQALIAIQQALDLAPGLVEAILLQAELRLQQGEAQAVIAPLERLLNAQRNIYRAQVLLAQAYRSVGRYGDAARLLEGQLKALPDRAETLVLLAMTMREMRQLDRARELLDRALEIDPDHLLGLAQWLEIAIEQRRHAPALAAVEERLSRQPDSAALVFLKGRVLAAANRWAEAEVELRRSLELDANLVSAYEFLVSGYLQRNELDQAARHIESFLAVRPENVQGRMLAAMIYERQGDVARARQAYERVLTTDPNSALALNNIAYLDAQDPAALPRALQSASKARSLRPSDPSIADTLGWINYQLGRYPVAFRLLREAAAGFPEHPEVAWHFGLAAEAVGDETLARDAFTRAARSSHAGAAERLRQLEEMATLSRSQLAALAVQRPRDSTLFLRLARAERAEKDDRKAAGTLEAARRENPTHVPILIELADLYAGPLAENAGARQLLRQARELQPDDPAITSRLGRLALAAGDFIWADSLLRELDALDPETRYDAALAAYSVGRVSEARAGLERLLSAGDLPASLGAEARALLALMAPEVSAADARVALDRDPRSVPALVALARTAPPVEAETLLERALAIYPEFAPAKREMTLLAVRKATPPSEVAYRRAMEARKAFPDDNVLARALAELAYRRADYAFAAQLIEETSRAAKVDPVAWYIAGRSYAQLKRAAQATRALNAALADGLPEPYATKAREILAEGTASESRQPVGKADSL